MHSNIHFIHFLTLHTWIRWCVFSSLACCTLELQVTSSWPDILPQACLVDSGIYGPINDTKLSRSWSSRAVPDLLPQMPFLPSLCLIVEQWTLAIIEASEGCSSWTLSWGFVSGCTSQWLSSDRFTPVSGFFDSWMMPVVANLKKIDVNNLVPPLLPCFFRSGHKRTLVMKVLIKSYNVYLHRTLLSALKREKYITQGGKSFFTAFLRCKVDKLIIFLPIIFQ